MLDDRDLIFVSLEPWDEMWRRNQFICDELMRRYPKMKMLFVGPSRDWSAGLRRLDWSYLKGARPKAVAEYPNLHFLEANKFFPKSLLLGRSVNGWLVRRRIREIVAALGMRDPILWINSHEMEHLAGKHEEAYCIYDITDDWTQMSSSSKIHSLIRAQDESLCSKSDAVIVCSEDLYETRKGLAENIHLIPNGVNVGHYRRVLEGPCIVPNGLEKLKGPILGYTGTIHPDRMDFELLFGIAHANVEATILLVGPNYLAKEECECLLSLGNVRMVGAVGYDEIPDYMALFDVCIVPHLVNTFTESLNPIKLWEYLASGKPIISTPVAGFRDYETLVELAKNVEEFNDAVVRCMHEDGEAAAVRQGAVASQTWSHRVDQIVEVFEGCESARARVGVGL